MKIPFPVSDTAKEIHREMVNLLNGLNALEVDSCLSELFRKKFIVFLSLFEQYQRSVLDGVGARPSCKRGCSHCCNHWVEDVNSFEAEIIADYIKHTYPDEIPRIIQSGEKDRIELEHLEHLMSNYTDLTDGPDAQFDHVDFLLTAFYQLKRPCPLLDSKGNCMVYSVRPVTCRIYMSFSEPMHCKSEYINTEDTPTYLLDVDESASELLDSLHFRFLRFQNDTGLRSILCKYLLNSRDDD